MARPVYSTQLAAAQSISSGPTLIYTAPAGYTTDVRMMSAVAGLNPFDVWWAVSLGSSGPRIAGASHGTGTGEYTNDLLQGRWILNPGDELFMSTDGSTWDMFLGGYLLTLP